MAASETTIQALPKATVRLIGSAQVITSVTSVVKELVENSLDAGATSVEVKLENSGLDKVEVRDNGRGIPPTDTAVMARPHYTSKISDTQDLGRLATYGFRGEALGSLCAVSRVSITTKTSDDDVSMTYDLTQDGAVTDKKPSHLGQGTTVLATQLFHSVPVRRQYYSSTKRRKEEVKKVEDLIIAFSVIKHDVRFTLHHNREVVWQKNGMSSIRQVLLRVFGSTALSHMVHKEVQHTDPQCDVELYVPRPDANPQLMTRSGPERFFVFINHRPVSHGDVSKLLRQCYSVASGCESSRWPLACVSIVVPAASVDVNLEPNKTKVLLQENSEVLSVLSELLEEVYGKKEDEQTQDVNGATTGDDRGPHAEFDRENKENRNDIKVAPSTSKPADNTTTDSDFTLGLSEDMTSDLTLPQVKDVTSDLTLPQVKDVTSDLTLPQVKDVTSDLTLPQVKDVTSDLTLPQVKDVTSDLTLPQVKDVTSDLTLPQVKDVTSELHVSKDVDFTIPKVKDVNSELTKVVTADTTSPEVRDRSCGDLTLPLTRPLHNSTRCDLTDDPVSTQSVTFDLLKDWDDEDDLFRSLQDGTETTDGTVNKDTLETIGCRLTQKASDQRLRPPEASVSRADVDQTGPALPSLDTSLLVTGDLSTAGSTWVRSAGVGEEGQVEGAQVAPTGSEWTRGASVKASGGDKVQPVQLLLPRSSSLTLDSSSSSNTSLRGGVSFRDRPPDVFSSPQARMERAANSPGQMKLTDVTNNSHVKRPTTAFIYFSKETRPRVVEETPGADFQTVARLIGERWKGLSEAERDKYEKMMTKDVERYRAEVSGNKDASSPSLNRTNRKRKTELGQSVMSMLRSPQVERPKKKPRLIPRTTITVDFSVTKLRERLADDTCRTPRDDPIPRVVGEVRPAGWWVGTQAGHVIGIVPWRLQETLIYAQLMEQHSLTTEKLREPIHLSPSAAGGDSSWQTLLSLSSMRSYQTDSTYSYVTDPRVTRSGFGIRKTQDQSPRVEVVSMTTAVNHFGLSDLQEVLAKVSDQPSVTVNESRPTKVKLYLQSEAVRMSRQMAPRFTGEEVRDLLRRRSKRLSPDDHACFHQRPFLHRLYDLSAVPSSQTGETGGGDA